MKTFFVAIFVTVFMLSGVGLYVGYLNETADELTALTEKILEFAEQKDWHKCQHKTEELKGFWETRKRILCAFTDHGDLDMILRTINEVHENAKYEDAQETVMYASVLLIQIKRLVEDERPSWENILRHTQEKGKRHNML